MLDSNCQVNPKIISLMMRRTTRSNSTADASVSQGARRSLRSTHNEEFYEIPTNFRVRSPRSSAPEKSVEKSPCTRKSVRLNSDLGEIENKHVENAFGCTARKRRYPSCPEGASVNTGTRRTRTSSVKDLNGLGNGLKPSKVSHLEEPTKHSNDAEISSPSCTNGICSRTRRKREHLKENGIGESHSNNLDDSGVSDNKYARELSSKSFAEMDNTTSSFQNRLSGGTTECNTAPVHPLLTTSNPLNAVAGSLICNGANTEETDNIIAKEQLSNPQNDTKCKCDSSTKDLNKDLCELCGKPRPLLPPRKNGSISNTSLNSPCIDDIGITVHNLRSTGQATTISSFASPETARSPLAAEEAGSKTETNVNGDEASLHLACRHRQRIPKGECSEPEGATKVFLSEGLRESQIKTSQSPLRPTESAMAQSDKERESKSLVFSVDGKLNEIVPESNHAQEKNVGKNHSEVKGLCDVEEKKHSVGEVHSQSVYEEFACSDLDFSSLSDLGSDSTTSRKRCRKMNLRSSGVRCDPDFYTLSLDLMIKKPSLRKLLPWEEDSVKSDTEVDRSVKLTTGTEIEDQSNSNRETAGKSDCVDLDDLRDNDINALFTNLSKTNSAIVGTNQISSVVEDDDSNACHERSKVVPTALLPQHSSTPARPTAKTLQKVPPRGKGRGPRGLVSSKLDKSPTVRMVVPDPNKPPPLFNDEPPSGPDVYYFESDHVALKHNKDYHDLLHTVSMLEAQRHQCLEDIEKLEKQKSKALESPICFVEKLQSQVELRLPTNQKVPQLPEIDWSRYTSVYGTFDHVFSSGFCLSPKKPVTRKVKINFETGVPLQPTENPSSSRARAKSKSGTASQNGANRSGTFKVLWTVEEQRKLEELLQKFPSEEIEFNRYRKIAAAFGNRTPLQVQSRVQKYFIKLAKAGLPIPGNMPRLDRSVIGCRNRKTRPHPHLHLTKMSTFFPKFHVPVRMQDERIPGKLDRNEEEDGGGWSFNQDQVSDEEDVSSEMRFSDEYLEILRLKRMRRERLRVVDQHGRQALAQHVGYECDMCNCDPIEGVRYHCIDCPTEDGVDLCQSCIRWQGQFETENHTTSHRMEPVYKAENFMDDDYIKFVSRTGEYNYLDPNFFPPST